MKATMGKVRAEGIETPVERGNKSTKTSESGGGGAIEIMLS